MPKTVEIIDDPTTATAVCNIFDDGRVEDGALEAARHALTNGRFVTMHFNGVVVEIDGNTTAADPAQNQPITAAREVVARVYEKIFGSWPDPVSAVVQWPPRA